MLREGGTYVMQTYLGMYGQGRANWSVGVGYCSLYEREREAVVEEIRRC